MAFLVSPGVEVKEKDLTNIIPAVATAIGGVAGLFEWGPAKEATLVSSEADLIDKFGYPRTSTNAASSSRSDWYSAANFLAYSNALQVTRVITDGARNSASEASAAEPRTFELFIDGTANASGTVAVPFSGSTTVNVLVTNGDTAATFAAAVANAIVAAGTTAVATGDTVNVAQDSDSAELPSSVTVNGFTVFYSENSATAAVPSAASIANNDEFLTEGDGLVNGSVYARYVGELGNSIGVMLVDAGATDLTQTIGTGTATLADYFDDVPGTSVWATNNVNDSLNDEVHVIVYTTNDKITGTANEVLETYAFLSKIKNAKTADSGANFYVDVINNASQWIYIKNEQTSASSAVNAGTFAIGATINGEQTGSVSSFITNNGTSGIRVYSLAGGSDGTTVADGDYTEAYDVLNDAETVDVSLLITGARSKTVQKHVISIAEARKDCMAFVSPDYASAVTNPTSTKIVDYFNNATDGFNSTSYAVFDSAWKRQYDRYNDEYFWIPVNADIAGIVARTESTNDAWFSPAGLNRGYIKNVVKLSFNPNQADRDALYTKRVNPVVTFRGQGTLLYGDKTALSRPSAFDRINVRRLFIVLEKAIATASKYQLFEFNDDFTRRLFVNAVEPFLADVKTRRGVTDYKVVCDESNNTGQVVDANRFVADIYIKPTRSINFITLNFVAVRSGVSFNEVVGA